MSEHYPGAEDQSGQEQDPYAQIPTIYAGYEGQYSGSDPELIDEVKDQLTAMDLDTDQLVYSGFDGSFQDRSEPGPKPDIVFVASEATWRLGAEIGDPDNNPATYAEDAAQDADGVPMIGVYDATQLRRVGYSETHQMPLDGSQEIGQVEHAEQGKTPADALVALVRF